MHLNIIDAVYCPRYDEIVSLTVCKKRQNNEGCPHYIKERSRKDGIREIICSYSEEADICQCKGEISTVIFRHNIEVCRKCNKPLSTSLRSQT